MKLRAYLTVTLVAVILMIGGQLTITETGRNAGVEIISQLPL